MSQPAPHFEFPRNSGTSTTDIKSVAPLILVVDDDPDITYLLGQILEVYGYRVATADHSGDVLATARAVSPDLIVMDVSLDGVDGVALTHALRSITGMEQTPVLLITARASIRSAVASAGAQDGLSKPFTITDLLSHVAHALKEANVHIQPLPLLPDIAAPP